MGQLLYTLAVLLALLRPNIAEPYGRLGCRFSPVCEEQEVCAEDKLFGTCTKRHSPYLPVYKLDNVGLHRLKASIRYLINSGYAWDDKYAQDSLRTVLDPYRQEYLDVNRADLQAYVEEWLTKALEQELEEEYLVEIAKEYQAMMDNSVDGGQPSGYVQQQQGPYSEGYGKGVGEQQMADYYAGENGSQGGATTGEESVDLDYLAGVAEEYLRASNQVRSEKAEDDDELEELYRLYREKYAAAVLDNPGDNAYDYSEDDMAQPEYNGINTASEEAATDEEDLQVLKKLQRMKEYMQEVYQEHKNDPQPLEENEVLAETTADDGNEDVEGAFSSSSSAEMMMPMQDFSSSGGNVDSNTVDEDSWGPGLSEGVTPNQIEQLVPSETESALNELFGSYMYDQEQWDKLSDDQKEELLNKMFSALGLLEQSSLASATDEFTGDEGEDVESPVAMEMEQDNNNILDVPVPAGYSGIMENRGIMEKKDDQQEDDETGPNLSDSFGYDQQVELDVPEDSQEDTTKASGKGKESKHVTEEPTGGYVFIALFFPVTKEQGKILVEELANLLDIPQSTFTEISVKDKTITFKVNGDIMAPQDIAETAASFKKEFEGMGVEITATGVGKETHVKVLEPLSDDNSTLVVLTVVLVACVLGILVAVIGVYCFRQKAKTKQKLQGLSSGGGVETEASADYQDLCRQRMASKSSEKPEPLSRISSVAMSEGAQPSPSSRSSTSSWSEEPVQSNMDISTGHVVLSYMEDHLKNKDRLHEEWEALCNYEADMCNTKVGASNPSKNRNNSVLPYDHTRVVLNDSSNSSRSDYINASTITDTDPRSPAYIATQAPLPTTLADFWQMVWEQGSVVIVNMCKLTENDVSRHRYWPEEGSALYHIYEVHLVSEHVWCEDYLVRSFYLKNLETQETRTVTQFHFLTWPEDGVPPSPKASLEFRRKVNKSYRGKACPIVVHCSDGIGRTGTFCLMDMVLTRMTKGAKEIDIAATLEHIRDQRPGMVKRKDQFEFALQAVAEEVNAILKALPQ